MIALLDSTNQQAITGVMAVAVSPQTAGGGPPSNIYLRPGGVFNYFRPDGASFYLHP